MVCKHFLHAFDRRINNYKTLQVGRCLKTTLNISELACQGCKDKEECKNESK